MNIKQYDFKREYEQYAQECEKKAIEVLRSGWYTLGEELRTFEDSWAKYTGAKYCYGCASGLDALWITFRLLGIGPGDEVIVQANTYIASVMGITMNGASPVFVEPDRYYGIDAEKIEEKITPKTKAILVVHLYGMPCQMDRVVEICKKHDLRLVEDCAQSHGATFKGQMTGTFGDVGCFSFFPSKTLGAYGDAGGIVTDDKDFAERFKVFRNYGSTKRYHFREVGTNSRLDEMQAGLLSVKLKHFDEIVVAKQKIADRYLNEINNPEIVLQPLRDDCVCTWHQFVVKTPKRDELKAYLEENGIDTYIHYPIPPHLSEAYAGLGYKRGDFPITEEYADTVLSLPMYNGMTKEEQDYVIDHINRFK